MSNCKNICIKLKSEILKCLRISERGEQTFSVNIFSCCRRAAQKESEGRMRPAGHTLPITNLSSSNPASVARHPTKEGQVLLFCLISSVWQAKLKTWKKSGFQYVCCWYSFIT